MASVKGDGEGLVQGQTAVPGDSLGTATAALNSHSAPSTKPGPNLDLLSVGTCICCVCCTSLRSYNQRPNAAAIPARLQESSADQKINSRNELQEYQSQLLPQLCPTPLLAGLPQLPGRGARAGVPIPAPQPGVSALGAPCVWLWCCQPSVGSVVLKAFPPSHQQQVLSLRSNAGTESIPRQMFL